MSGPSVCLLAILLIPASFAEAEASGLRGIPQVSAKDVENSLLAELASTFRDSANSEHVSRLEVALSPMYTAAPKEADGRLGHAVVRYMLHRLFVQQHGWYIRGLEPGSGNQATSGHQSLQNLQEWVPSYLQGFLEEIEGGRGVSLQELAVLAATFDDLVHKEAVTRLDKAFRALELSHSALLDEAALRQALEVWMMIYMLGGNFSDKITGQAKVLRAHNIFTEKLKDWGNVQQWMHSIQLEVAPASDHNAVDFSDAARVVEEVGRRYGTYNDKECNLLKSELLEIESAKAGRVRLAEFYRKGLAGVFNFNEKVDYLRTLGALDESDPSQPHVIVPNYVSSRPNCLVASGFYVVCCRNECEDLLSVLEQKIAGATAKPEQIREIVSNMSSATVASPRKLTVSLLARLYSIADANHGSVPLHGRLFAQWMHHAFPRECPYPHQAGSTSPQTPDEWLQATGQQDAKHSKEEMQAHVNKDGFALPMGPQARKLHDLEENELPWDQTEELLITRAVPQELRPLAPQRSLFNSLGLASFLVGSVILLWKLMPSRKTASVVPMAC